MFGSGRAFVVLTMVAAIFLGVIGIGGALLSFLLSEDDGIVFEVLLLVIGVSSLAMGAMIVRRER